MDMDRRTFGGMLLAGAGAAAVGLREAAAAAPARLAATVIVDAATGRAIHRSGVAVSRFTPCSTFKVPLALMGFDAGILKDAHNPAWDYVPERHQAVRDIDKQRTDPTSFEANSVIWFSREITARLGAARFKAYVDRFGYGNRDVRGNPGRNDGLTHSWLQSSLKISPDEQVAFLRRMLAHRLVSAKAHALTEQVIPVFRGAGGWRVHGKTGSGNTAAGHPLGWFVGWAERDRRRIIFARFGAGAWMRKDMAGGPGLREAMLQEIAGLAG